MKLASIKSKISQNENDEYVANLGITEVVFVYCNIVNKNYQQKSIVLYVSVPNKLFGDSKFSYIEVWIADQNSNLLEIEDRINIPFVIN